jgi:benzylsuccinate CoA-transferase BbsF subunit
VNFLVSVFLSFRAGGVPPGRPGNADDHAAPHGVYPCQGDDRWCAIACTNEDEWQALARAIGADWTERTEFASLAGRKASETELNRLVGEWTRAFEASALMDRLQAAGVPAGAVRSCADLHRDPQLRARGAFVECPHPEMGRGIHEASPFRCLTSPGTLRRAPLLGEHTEDVLEGLLGMPGEEIARLRSAGVVG